MTSRDRVLKTINHAEPDMIPIDFGGFHTSIHAIGEQKLKDYLGFRGGKQVILDYFQYIVFPDERLLELFQSDCMPVIIKPSGSYRFKINKKDDTYHDEWGNKYGRPKGGYFYDFKEHVMRNFSIEDIDKFKFPDPLDKARTEGLREEILKINNDLDKASILFSPLDFAVDFVNTMRSYEQAYIDLALNLDIIERLMQRNMEWQKLLWKNVLDEIGDVVDVVAIGDDLGGQNGPLFNPLIFRKIFKPFYKELLSFIKSKTKSKIYLHSCGSIYEFIPDLIEVGIDILNPVQVSAKDMDTKKLKKEFGKDIVFWGGGCDSQTILPNKTPKEIEEEVKRRIDDLAPGGGFVFAPIHNIQFNVPPENVIALFESAIKYRKYK